MKDKEKKILIICVCLLISVAALCSQIFKFGKNVKEHSEKTKQEKVIDTESEKSTNKFDYSNKKLPSVDNKSSAETNDDGYVIKVYFTNTDKLDKSTLPLQAQSEISKDSQKYLYQNGFNDVTELAIQPDSFVDDKNHIQFQCSMKGHKEEFQIIFDKKESKFKFSTVIIDTE